MKTPDEINKEAGIYTLEETKEILQANGDYVYSLKKLCRSALAYIRRLERERDAAVADLSNCDGNCHFCDWFGDTGCVAPDDGKQPKHAHDCPFKWSGVKEDNL